MSTFQFQFHTTHCPGREMGQCLSVSHAGHTCSPFSMCVMHASCMLDNSYFCMHCINFFNASCVGEQQISVF